MRIARLISFVLIVSVAGLSSSFALCVSACTDEAPGTAAHACHDQSSGESIVAGDGTCPHGLTIVQQGDLTRDYRAPLTIAPPVASLAITVATVSVARTRATVHPPGRPVSSPPILRI